MKQKRSREEELKRINKKVIAFNNKELKAIDYYCKKYRVENKTRFMREAIITVILKKFDEDYPTLWDGQLKLFPHY
ncbi:MAG TPA: hypothetical protein VHO72_04550 [Bacteroidales bacterium]|nr:hypothetical protein [Bacteroidales bacterium]